MLLSVSAKNDLDRLLSVAPKHVHTMKKHALIGYKHDMVCLQTVKV